MSRRRRYLVLGTMLALCGLLLAVPQTRRRVLWMIGRTIAKKTVADRVAEFGPAVRTRLGPEFARLGCAYPAQGVVLVGFKQERLLEVWVAGVSGGYRHLKTYPILAASGTLGPKLREGDRQVPEGVYRVESLNPNSAYHLSLRLNYPNEFDRTMAVADGRSALGGDIMIHGSDVSIGCVAVGDQAIEELFVLAAETGLSNIAVILAPSDLYRDNTPQDAPGGPPWGKQLYDAIRSELTKLRHSTRPIS
jgi:hypothetical protein